MPTRLPNIILALGFMIYFITAHAQSNYIDSYIERPIVSPTYDAATGKLNIPMVAAKDASYTNVVLRNTGGNLFVLEQVIDCSAYKRLASAEELSKTPRLNQEAEVLAIEASDAFIAPQSVYDRVVRDLSSIRLAHAEIQGITAIFAPPNQMMLSLDGHSGVAVIEGRYSDADCLNSIYGATGFRLISADFTQNLLVIPTFSGRFNIPMLAAEYAKLPGIISANPNGLMGDGSDVCLSIEGETFYYIFDEASGDCPAGCIYHNYRDFSTDMAGNITPSPSVSNQLQAACKKWL